MGHTGGWGGSYRVGRWVIQGWIGVGHIGGSYRGRVGVVI